MIGLLCAMAVAGAAAPTDPGERIAQSAAAAQGLAGPLDGPWRIDDAAGRLLFALVITDPPQGAHPISASWRAAGVAAVGPVRVIRRAGRVLTLAFETADGASVRLRLRLGRLGWRGVLIRGGRRSPVSLRRGG